MSSHEFINLVLIWIELGAVGTLHRVDGRVSFVIMFALLRMLIATVVKKGGCIRAPNLIRTLCVY
jgi:hypothetical protein